MQFAHASKRQGYIYTYRLRYRAAPRRRVLGRALRLRGECDARALGEGLVDAAVDLGGALEVAQGLDLLGHLEALLVGDEVGHALPRRALGVAGLA